MMNVFVSYCQKDKIYADYIDLFFKDKSVVIHRDVRDIPDWKSIKEYMNTIRKMDYAILIITDNYLKSFNCMYEVLEVMKDLYYKDKIFPVVVERSIYQPVGRVSYVSYWQEKYRELEAELKPLGIASLGPLTEDLKKTHNITLSVSEFLGLVSDMNNPEISDINIAIENKLKEKGLFETDQTLQKPNKAEDLFSSLGLSKTRNNTEPTDFEKTQFVKESYSEIQSLLSKLCTEYQKENSGFRITIDQVDSRNCVYEFYDNGKMIRGLKVFLGSMFGSGNFVIGVSENRYSLGSNNSWNGMYSVNHVDGELKLVATMSSFHSQEPMTVNDVVRDIWASYIQPYI